MEKVQALKDEIIRIGRDAWLRGLVAATSGNLSVRVDEDRFLITAHTTRLGDIRPEDILLATLEGKVVEGKKKHSAEIGVHLAAHRELEARAVVHLHPPYTSALAALDVEVKPMTFETSLFLGTVPVIPQETPAVGHLDEVIEALKLNKVVILKNHGTLAIGDDLNEAFSLTEILEEAALMTFIKQALGRPVEKAEDKKTQREAERFPVFSQEHIGKITQLINDDVEAQRLGKETSLTTRWAIHMIEDDTLYTFHFLEGRVAAVDSSDDCDFLVSGRREHWVAVFNGRVDPFVATTQKRLKLKKGHLGDLSRWYPPFCRIFELWKMAPVE